MQDDLCWSSLLLGVGIGGRSCSNILGTTASASDSGVPISDRPEGHGSCLAVQQGPWYDPRAELHVHLEILMVAPKFRGVLIGSRISILNVARIIGTVL